jgi:predicted transcriptional regulator
MSSAKVAVQGILDQLPDDVTLEQIEYEIFIRRKVEQGDADVAAGRVLTMDEMQVRFARWLDDSAGRR